MLFGAPKPRLSVLLVSITSGYLVSINSIYPSVEPLSTTKTSSGRVDVRVTLSRHLSSHGMPL